MIVVDPLFSTAPHTGPRTPRCFRNTQSCHLMSTLEGEAGRQELLVFGRHLGLRPGWLQYPGTRRQHFDLVASKRARAVELGAVEVHAGWMPGKPVPSATEGDRP